MEKTKRPSGSAFRQQRLSAWQPILTAGTVLPTFFVIGLAFIPIGIGLLLSSNEVQEFPLDYTYCRPAKDKEETCADILQKNATAQCRCFETFQLDEDIKPFVYVYYGLTNFYQNHRRYVKSRDDSQLLGHPHSTNGDCFPFQKSPEGLPIAPCGAIANSLFNDSFRILYNVGGQDGRLVKVTRTEISWPTDRSVKFRNPPNNNYNGTAKPPYWSDSIADVGGFTNESLIVWMRTAALPTFRKLYGRVDPDDEKHHGGLLRGNYTIQIDYRFPVHMFKGSKRIILSNTSWLGGKNPFLGIAYITVGVLCLILALVFFVIHKKFGKNTRDLISITQRTPY